MDAGNQAHLTYTWVARLYEGLKFADDRHDVRWLVHLLWMVILPEGCIYPKVERSVHDLLRRRSFLVHKRTSFLLVMRVIASINEHEVVDAILRHLRHKEGRRERTTRFLRRTDTRNSMGIWPTKIFETMIHRCPLFPLPRSSTNTETG